MSRRRRGRRIKRNDPELQDFLEHVASNVGGYYKVLGTGSCVEFIRPLGEVMMRVKDMKTGRKFNVDYLNLKPMNEMEVLALQLSDPEPLPAPPVPQPKPKPRTQKKVHESVDDLFDDLMGRT